MENSKLMENKSIGQILYEGYCAHTNWKSLASGQDLPQWAGLRPDIQTAWEASGNSLSNHLDNSAVRTEPDYTAIIARLQDPNIVRLLHAGIGMATETGEFLDALKKYIYYGKPLDRVNLKEEIGDMSWYARIGADALMGNFVGIMLTNIKKLRARFPDKFTEGHARERDLSKEREVLEGDK